MNEERTETQGGSIGNMVDRYEIICKIGKGTYGKVYKAKDRATGEFVAVKKIIFHVGKRDQNQEEGYPSTALREICLLKKLSHPSIVAAA